MFDEKNLQKDDALAKRLEHLSSQVKPSPALMKAAKTGVPLRSNGIRYTAGMHVRKFSKAVLAYAAGVAILLGCVFLLPKLFGEGDPVATQPSQTTTTAPNPETCEHKYVISSYVPDDPCTTGPRDEYICELCGHRYTKSHPPLGHEFVGGVCTRCGEKEETNPAWSLEQFGDPSVIETALARMGLTLDRFSAANLPKAKSFLGNDDLHGFLMSYYYNCEEISPMELYYTFGEKCRLTADELADLGVSADSLSMDCYRFTGEEATALLTQYAAVQPTWADGIRPVLIALGYPYRPDTFYSFVDPDYLAVKRIIVNGCGIAQSGEWIVFYETQEGDRCMVALLPDGNSYRFVANCPTDYLHHDAPPPPADCEHGQDLATCPYCNCAGHEFADNTCTKCGLVCQHEYSGVNGGICILCGTECMHNYSEGTCNVVCTLCGNRQGHDYEEIVSTDHICTEGTITTTTCRRCGYSYTEITPAKGHSYENGACTVCGETQKTVTVTDPDVTAGSVSLLPGQMYQTYPTLSGDGITWVDPTMTPYYYNVYTYFEGYTVTDIRVPVYYAEKGSVLTIGVAKVENGLITDRIASYELTADREIDREWVLFSGLSIEVPEGCTLTFGWMSDTLSYASPVTGYIPGYSRQDDYSGLGSQIPLIFDVYGKKS